MAPISIQRSSCQYATIANSMKTTARWQDAVRTSDIEFPPVDRGRARVVVQQDRGNQVSRNHQEHAPAAGRVSLQNVRSVPGTGQMSDQHERNGNRAESVKRGDALHGLGSLKCNVVSGVHVRPACSNIYRR